MTQLNACIFDLDGVIVDTATYHYLAWRRLANELGFDFSKEDNERLKGVSRMRSLEILLEVGNYNEPNEGKRIEMASKKNAWYVAYISQMTKDEILPGVISFLEELRQQGIKISLGSASKNAMTILKGLDLLPFFDAVIDGTKTQRAKPDPEVFLLGASALGCAPETCVVFEDAASGIEAANAANMFSIGVGSPHTLGHADWVIPNLEGLEFAHLLSKIGLSN